jgi:ribonuclease HI
MDPWRVLGVATTARLLILRSVAPLPLPIRPTKSPGTPNKFKGSTIHEITKGIPRNIEKVTPAHTIPPQRTNAQDIRYATRLTTKPAQRGLTKREAADEHRTRITQLSQDADTIITYTDGSMKEKEQENRTGAGWVLYWKGVERRNGSEGMSKHAEAYEAEMLALLRGLEMAIEFQKAMPKKTRKRSRIILFADNTSSVASITNEKPGSSRQISQQFVETAATFLNENERASIEVSWVPGHMGIEGNVRADGLAKRATNFEPATETTTIAKLHRQLRENVKMEWVTEWARKPMTGRCALAARMLRFLAGSDAFRTLNRHTLGIIKQARAGHGYFGEYYQAQEPVTCPCGAELQIREHMVFECQSHEEH